MNSVLENLSHLMIHRKKLDSNGFNDLITKILNVYPNMGWELGHSLENPEIDVLYLSTRNATDFMRIFEASPANLKIGFDWQIQTGLLPKDWQLFFEANFDGEVFEIEGKEWVWSIGENTNFDQLVFAPSTAFPKTFSNQNLAEIGEIILIGELGEINYLTYIKDFSVLVSPNQIQGWQEMKKLRFEFVKLNPTCFNADWLSNHLHV